MEEKNESVNVETENGENSQNENKGKGKTVLLLTIQLLFFAMFTVVFIYTTITMIDTIKLLDEGGAGALGGIFTLVFTVVGYLVEAIVGALSIVAGVCGIRLIKTGVRKVALIFVFITVAMMVISVGIFLFGLIKY